MQQSDYDDFSALIADVHAFYRQNVSPFALSVWWAACRPFDLDAVRDALGRHAVDPDVGKFMPKPADLICRLGGKPADDGRPGPDEAWAMIPHDEDGSVVWTAEAAKAFAVAQPLIAAGERIAARMAFLEVYRREVDEARQAKRPVQWTPSLGHDPTQRDAALVTAVERGRLTVEQAQALSPLIALPGHLPRLEHKPDPKVREMLAGLAKGLARSDRG